jgi:hypothetical protein
MKTYKLLLPVAGECDRDGRLAGFARGPAHWRAKGFCRVGASIYVLEKTDRWRSGAHRVEGKHFSEFDPNGGKL